MLESHSTVSRESNEDMDLNILNDHSMSQNLTNDCPSTSNNESKEKDRTDTDDVSSSMNEYDSESSVSFDYKEKAVRFWKKEYKYNGIVKKKNQRARKNKSLTAVKSQFKRVQSVHQLYRWEKMVLGNGALALKIKSINEAVIKKFNEANENKNIIHDADLRKWGIQAAKDMNLTGFKASNTWLAKLKKNNNIVSRKITKFVTRKEVNSEEAIKKSADDFVARVREEMKTIGPENTYNSDQSGFQFEMHSGRTLSKRGSRSVKTVAQSLNATTHSYTIQPTMNANGELLSPLLLVLPEPSGQFGPVVRKTMFQAPNLKVVATRSGKCTTEVLRDWYKNVLKPKIQKESLLLLDAYGGFNAATQDNDGESSDDEGGNDVQIHIRRIPKHTTGISQPFDILGFRPYKQMTKKISDSPEIEEHQFSLRTRDNVIKLQSIIFNQMCSPRYNNMFRYGWYKGGYLDEHPPVYQTPVEYSFRADVLHNCEEENCTKNAFIRCGWCTKQLCFEDFILKYHLCYDFQE